MRIIARGKEVQTSVCQMMIQRPWESMTSIHNSGKNMLTYYHHVNNPRNKEHVYHTGIDESKHL